MINEIRHRLVLKYTVVIALVLLGLSLLSYFMQKMSNVRFVEEGLEDYLDEEIWEAQRFVFDDSSTVQDRVHKIASNAESFHNYTFWYKNNVLIHTEEPLIDDVAQQLRYRMENDTFENGRVYHVNIVSHGQEWFFFLMKQSMFFDDGASGEVFVLCNYTGMRVSTNIYLRKILISALILTLIAVWLGRFLVNKSMVYISRSYDKQKQFIADASHELRTPLSVLMGYTELLEYRYGESSETKAMKKEIDGVSALIDALLDIARFDNGKMSTSMQKIDMKDLVQGCLDKVALIAENTEIVTHLESDVEVVGDERLTRQLILILLDNAVKYSNPPRFLNVVLKRRGTVPILEIGDNGIGIDKAEQQLIFERFYRADKAREATVKGSGLGLALADAIVKLHGWRIELVSAPQKGSVFTIVFDKH